MTRRLEDQSDLAAAKKALDEAKRKGTIPWEKVKEELVAVGCYALNRERCEKERRVRKDCAGSSSVESPESPYSVVQPPRRLQPNGRSAAGAIDTHFIFFSSVGSLRSL